MPASILTVSPAEEGMKLFAFLRRRLPAPSSLLHRWIRTGDVRINGGRGKPFAPLAAGDQVRIPPFKDAPGQAAPDGARPARPAARELVGPVGDDKLLLLRVEEDLLVLCKAPGLPSQPGTAHADSVSTRLAALFAGADYVPAPAHRLDRMASGLILAGRTHRAQQRLHALFADKSAREESALLKEYLVRVGGAWPQGERVLEDFLLPAPAGMVLTEPGAPGALRALCRVVPLRLEPQSSLLKIELLTGRKHQIRVQCAARGHPVGGDSRYLSLHPEAPAAFIPAPALMLHAWRLTLRAADGSPRVFEAPLPFFADDFQDACETARDGLPE